VIREQRTADEPVTGGEFVDAKLLNTFRSKRLSSRNRSHAPNIDSRRLSPSTERIGRQSVPIRAAS
jgi:hypothetical protein